MAYIVLRPGDTNDDASQSAGWVNYYSITTTLTVRSSTEHQNYRTECGVRFRTNNHIPAGTTKITDVYVYGFVSVATTGVNCTIKLVRPYEVTPGGDLDTMAFKTAGAGGGGQGATNSPPGDPASTNDIYYRDVYPGSVDWNDPGLTKAQYEEFQTPDLKDLFKEMMIDAGAVFADLQDPYLATTPTQQAINNPIILFKSKSGVSEETFTFFSCDWGTDAIKKLSIPRLEMIAQRSESVLQPSDRRTHIAILSDSYGWAMQPDLTDIDPDNPNQPIPASYLALYLSDLGQDHYYELYKLHNPPRGMVSTYDNGKYYSIDDPTGQGGGGSIRPEGRSGYTKNGVLKDVLMQELNVLDSDIVIHPFGYGGTTASPISRSTGVWSTASKKSDPVVYLDPDNLSNINNSLWKFKDPHGHTAVELLQDTSIERLIIIYTGGGNDFFGEAYQNAYLPITYPSTSGLWTTLKANLQNSYEIIGRFCHGVRDNANAAPLEFIIAGYPNFPTDDPRIPPVKIYEGGSAAGSYHRGSQPSPSDPDDEYGGPTGANGYMAPWGTFGQTRGYTHTPGTVNMIPHIPFFLQYVSPLSAFGGSFSLDVGPPQSNLDYFDDIVAIGHADEGVSAFPRAMHKTDLGAFLNLKIASYCMKTFNLDYMGTGYRYWYCHWAADHYGQSYYNPFDYPDTPNKRWSWSANNVFPGQNVLQVPGYPYHCAYNQNLLLLPSALQVAVAYCSRNITNEVLNGGMIEIIDEAQDAAIQTLSNEGIACQWVNLRDCLNDKSPDAVADPDIRIGTAWQSANRWAFLDGVHTTHDASKIYCEELINRAMANSDYLKMLTDNTSEAIGRFMSFFTEAW